MFKLTRNSDGTYKLWPSNCTVIAQYNSQFTRVWYEEESGELPLFAVYGGQWNRVFSGLAMLPGDSCNLEIEELKGANNEYEYRIRRVHGVGGEAPPAAAQQASPASASPNTVPGNEREVRQSPQGQLFQELRA